MYKRAAYFQHYRLKKKEKDMIGLLFVFLICLTSSAKEKIEGTELGPMPSSTRLRESRPEAAIIDL